MGIDSRAGSTGDVKDNDSAMNLKEIFGTVQTILVIDWPSKELPETLTRAGFRVVVRGGPGLEDYSAYELDSSRNLAQSLAHDPGEVVVRHIDRAPERADLIYSYRPLSELPEIITTAKRLGAKTIWTQSGLSAAGVNDPKGCWVPEEALRQARNLVESAGLRYTSEPYIGDVAQR
jgi:CoA binding domain